MQAMPQLMDEPFPTSAIPVGSTDFHKSIGSTGSQKVALTDTNSIDQHNCTKFGCHEIRLIRDN